MNKVKEKYIIVGQGLAGTILAQTLLKQNKSVVIIDEHKESTASKIAAGLCNPVVFKRLVKSWMADELIPFTDEFYTDAEEILNVNFYFKKQIVKLFAEEQEKAQWLLKCDEAVGKYLSKTIQHDFLNELIHHQHGSSEVTEVRNLDTVFFLESFRNYFRKNNCLLEEKFEYDQLTISKNGVTYKNNVADKIIFCEGYRAIDNPYFSWLPFKLTKGEIITIAIPSLKEIIPNDREIRNSLNKVINKDIFILPLGNNIFKVGATYEWNDLTEQPTEKGKAYLIDKLEKILKVPFEIINHQAGIRPTVNDRKPLIGIHPQYSSLAVFNGMGTKGVMLAPFFAKHLYDFLENKIPLHSEVNINRFIYTKKR